MKPKHILIAFALSFSVGVTFAQVSVESIAAGRDEIREYSEDLDIVLPPWIAFPSVSQYDLFWRMGLGEDYMTKWLKCYLNSDQTLYQAKFPATAEWEGIYD